MCPYYPNRSLLGAKGPRPASGQGDQGLYLPGLGFLTRGRDDVTGNLRSLSNILQPALPLSIIIK